MCTICNETAGTCSVHRSESHDAWERTYGDDIRELQRQLRDGEVSFAGFEMVS